MNRVRWMYAGYVLLAAGAAGAAGCRRGADRPGAPPPVESETPPPREVLDFPAAPRVEDAEVNAFIERAMKAAASGDYEAFRLLWSVRQEPLAREEYERGWQAVQSIRILALRKAILAGERGKGTGKDAAPTEREREAGGSAPGETVYLVLAEVALDPEHPAGRRRPQREVALMLVREHDSWRLARPPKVMAAWLRRQYAARGESPGPAGPAPPVKP